MTDLLVSGVTCASEHAPAKSGLLVDGRDYYKAVYDACCQAERTIVMAGWQFDHDIALLRGDDAKNAPCPVRLIRFLRELCLRKPQLEVHLLVWGGSPVFLFERVPFQSLMFRLRGHPRIHYRTDHAHPTAASQHQKLVIVDRAIAFVGGMDICNSRWDRRGHHAEDPDRIRRWLSYPPYHDVQAYVTGSAVDDLRAWFSARWQGATGDALELPDVPRRSVRIESTFDVEAPRAGLARTWPCTAESPIPAITEIYELHVRAIQSAERCIYLESQYFTCDRLADAFERRMETATAPLEIVLVLPDKSKRFKDRVAMGFAQRRILERLTAAAKRFNHHLGVYYSAAPSENGDVPVFVHSKVLAIDDRFLLVSSANATNRSMGFDSELGIAWEAEAATASLRSARIELLAEHCGLPAASAHALLAPIAGLVSRLDEMARSRTHRLRIHNRNADERPGPLLSKLLREATPFDPENVRAFQQSLPNPAMWFRRKTRRLET